jgi:RNA recognition motif-containing protein
MIETQKRENKSKKDVKKRNYEEKKKERIGKNLNESDTLEETKNYEINKKENKKLLKKKIKREDDKVNENASESEDNEKNELSTSLNPENIIDLNENDEDDPVENNIIFVKSYSGKLKQEDLRKLFENYGKLKKITVSSKNFGFVEFCHKNSVINVIKDKNKIYLNGKKLKIEYAKNKADKSITFNPSENTSQKKEINIRRKEKKSEKFIEIETENKKESGENNNVF